MGSCVPAQVTCPGGHGRRGGEQEDVVTAWLGVTREEVVKMTQLLPVPMSGRWEQAPEGHRMPSAETGGTWRQARGHHVSMRDGKGLLQGVCRLLRMQPGGQRRGLERRLRGSRAGSQEQAWESPRWCVSGQQPLTVASSQTPSHAPSSVPHGLGSVLDPWRQVEQVVGLRKLPLACPRPLALPSGLPEPQHPQAG